MSNRLDPDQERFSVSPDLGPNCLQKLSADLKSPLASKEARNSNLKTCSMPNNY